MEHILLKASTETVQDAGLFEAVISTASVDREGDIVAPQAMVDALRKWVPTGKNVPLAWHHSTAPEDCIGYCDPSTVRAVGNEVVISGWINQDTPRGKEAWRLCRQGSIGFSMGYLTTKARPREDGTGRYLDGLDIFEITATSAPMNNETRILALKAMTADELREVADAVAEGRDAELVAEQDEQTPAQTVEPEPTPASAPVPSPDQRRRAVQYARESASEVRDREEETLPPVIETPEEPKREETRVVPAASELRRRASNIESDAQAIERERELERLPEVPRVTPDPDPMPSTPRRAPATEELRRRAETAEMDTALATRLEEARTLPVVAPAPPAPAATPEPVAIPASAESLRRRAELTEAESALSARSEEQQHIPEVPEASEPPRPEEPEPVPSVRSQRQRAEMFEWELAQEARVQDERRVPDRPDVPDVEPDVEPDPVVVPETRAQRREAVALAGETAKALRREEEAEMPELEPVADEATPEPPKPPDAKTLQRRINKANRLGRQMAREEDDQRLPDLEEKVTAEPFSASRTSNWVARAGGLPHYIQHIAHDLVSERGMDESRAIATAIAICKRWAAGGKNVSADTRAKAAAAIAEWERMKASHGKAVGDPVNDPNGGLGDIEALVADLTDTERADLFETLYAQMIARMQMPGKSIDPDGQRQYADAVTRDVEGTTLLRITEEEMDGFAAGELKAVWSAAQVNDLPDASFLYVEADGSKDSDGKTTPRSLRHFPYKDANGNVDLPHLRNALARIPQSNLPDNVKTRLTKQAQAILDRQSKALVEREEKLIEAEDILASNRADETNRGQTARFVDPLRERAKAVELEFTSGGESLRKPPQQQEKVATPQPEMSLDDLRQRAHDEMLIALSGVHDL